MVLLQTILIVLIVYYGFKILWKWLGPQLLNFAVKKTEERFQQQFNGYHNNSQNADNEGDTTIVDNPSKRTKSSKKVGEYIDFEEID
ncbi:hypothetical protein GCM10011414_12060 [Croceivirga lutea]|uniref:DUF4834 family protein n=1 Tax=Croceivirga lutea TaxID=1775167 RepID=UPI0016397BBE|nr:DUF4834 family protein [Croceivirga lutea]GGG43994.1 hypothetical protein GCM10011414_12060 [Croceivirga lutea]